MNLSRLQPHHAASYRELMLLGYAQEPEAFTATFPEREPLPLDWWKRRLSDKPGDSQLVLGSFDQDLLVGVAGLRFHTRERTKHRATLFGMYVRPEFHRQGVGRDLVQGVLAVAKEAPNTLVVQLTVTESNAPAICLYESCGFERYGVEPFSNRVGTRFVSKVYMWRRVDSDAQ